MSPVFSARRRADEFAALVEDPSTDAADAARYADLLELVGAMRSESRALPEPRPDFVADLRERLMAAAETELAPAREAAATAKPLRSSTTAPRRTKRERRLAALVGGVAVVSASTSMAVAAQTALPGDTLYPLKRALENIQAGIANDPDEKASTLLDSATGRLDEVDELTRAGEDVDAEAIAETLRDFADQASEASDLLLDDYAENGSTSSIERLQDFTSQSTAALDALEGLVPDEARESLAAANEVVTQIEQELLAACPACLDLASGVDVAVDRLPSVLDTALGDLTAPVRPSEPPQTDRPGRPRSSGDPTAQPNLPEQPSASPAPPASTDQPPVEQPSLPTQPDRPGRPDETEAPVDADDPIGDLVEGATGGNANTGSGGGRGGSDDPVGDLLEGTGDAVDDVVGGLGGLGGQGG